MVVIGDSTNMAKEYISHVSGDKVQYKRETCLTPRQFYASVVSRRCDKTVEQCGGTIASVATAVYC